MKNDEVNWETIMYASGYVARKCFPLFNKQIAVDELQNECILFIHSFRPDSNLPLLKYAKGDMTDEKVAKLITALMRNKSWAEPLLKNGGNLVQHKTVTKEEAVAVIEKFAVDDEYSANTEEESLIVSSLRNRLNTKEKNIIKEAFADESIRKTVAAISAEYEVSERWVYKVKTKAIEVAMREKIPAFITYRRI